MLDGAMKPATKTIAQLLDEEPHFSSFRKRKSIYQSEWFVWGLT